MIDFLIIDSPHYKCAFADAEKNPEKATLIAIDKSKFLSKVARYSAKRNLMLLTLVCPKLRKLYFDHADCICVTDQVFTYLGADYFRWLKRKKKVTIVGLLYNKAALLLERNGNDDVTSEEWKEAKLPIDYMYSYDITECKRLGFEYFECYSAGNFGDIAIVQDVYYCGNMLKAWKQTRISQLNEVYKYLENNHVDAEFHLVVNDMNQPDLPVFAQKKRLEYSDILKASLRSNVILEIVSDGKYGATFRLLEAICYKRKLLTNNPFIREYPFFNSDNIRYFEKPEDIDIEWVLNRGPVEYGYNGDFSPLALVNLIESRK